MIKAKLNTCGNIIPMGDMKPMQVGVVVRVCNQTGHVVMRTQSECKFEVMNLTKTNPEAVWTKIPEGQGYEVRLLSSGESITIEISND